MRCVGGRLYAVGWLVGGGEEKRGIEGISGRDDWLIWGLIPQG